MIQDSRFYEEPDTGEEDESPIGNVYSPPPNLTYGNLAVRLAALSADSEEVYWGFRQDFGTRSAGYRAL